MGNPDEIIKQSYEKLAIAREKEEKIGKEGKIGALPVLFLTSI